MEEQKQSRPRPRFTKEFKARVVGLVTKQGQTGAQVAHDLEPAESVLYGGIRQAKLDRRLGLPGALASEEREELARVRKEVRVPRSTRKTPSFRSLEPASKKASEIARSSSRKRDTACELLLRKELWRLGLRYRVGVAITGRPDIVFRGAQLAIFCDGDFWHGRNLEERTQKLRSGHNASYWIEKIRSNVARDRKNTAALEQEGWRVLHLWETDIKRDPVAAATMIAGHLRERSLNDRRCPEA